MEYLTTAEFAEKWNVSQRRVAIYCKEGRIKGAELRGRMWMIPKKWIIRNNSKFHNFVDGLQVVTGGI